VRYSRIQQIQLDTARYVRIQLDTVCTVWDIQRDAVAVDLLVSPASYNKVQSLRGGMHSSSTSKAGPARTRKSY